MVIQRRCPVCHEQFSTTDRKRVFCSDYCEMAMREQRQEEKHRDRQKRTRTDRTGMRR